MPQITLYLDAETERLMRARARAAGLPYSRWIAQLIRLQAASEWPEDVVALAGRFPDFPTSESARSLLGADVDRRLP